MNHPSDGCCTEFETKQVVTQDKRVDIIDKKMDNIRDEFRKELSEIKQFIISSSQPLSTQSSIPTLHLTLLYQNLVNKKHGLTLLIQNDFLSRKLW